MVIIRVAAMIPGSRVVTDLTEELARVRHVVTVEVIFAQSDGDMRFKEFLDPGSEGLIARLRALRECV
jgi:hypothetical protein